MCSNLIQNISSSTHDLLLDNHARLHTKIFVPLKCLVFNRANGHSMNQYSRRIFAFILSIVSCHSNKSKQFDGLTTHSVVNIENKWISYFLLSISFQCAFCFRKSVEILNQLNFPPFLSKFQMISRYYYWICRRWDRFIKRQNGARE